MSNSIMQSSIGFTMRECGLFFLHLLKEVYSLKIESSSRYYYYNNSQIPDLLLRGVISDLDVRILTIRSYCIQAGLK